MSKGMIRAKEKEALGLGFTPRLLRLVAIVLLVVALCLSLLAGRR